MQRNARLLLVVWIAVLAAHASGQEGTREEGGDAAAGAPAPRKPNLGLDRLLDPRGGAAPSADATRPGGKDRESWQKQFGEATAEVEQLRARVEESQRRMRDAAGDAGYSYSPAGASETYDPDVLKTRAQLQRDRQSLEAAERRLRDLKVEASLAGVPSEWQRPAEAPSPPGD